MLGEWLKYNGSEENNYLFTLIHVTEDRSPDQSVIAYISEEVLKAYRNLGYLKFSYQREPKERLVDYLNSYVLPSEKNQITKNVGQGDFGEILASLIVTFFQNLLVPIHKLQWKYNKDRTLFCTDMIAHNQGEKIKDIYYYEIKTRSIIKKEKPKKDAESNYITVIAHNGLLKDELTPNEGIADFLSRYFYEKGDYDNSKKYFDIVKNPQKYNRNYELFFIIEKSKFITDILDDLNNLPPTLSPLNVTVVLIDELKRLIVETRQRVVDEAINYVYEK